MEYDLSRALKLMVVRSTPALMMDSVSCLKRLGHTIFKNFVSTVEE